MLFSIIVPVYNVEKYLDKCILSILNQDYNNYELLLIDDGSTDNSGHICDEYAKKYSCINVFHKKNGGLSDARNYGMKYAKGNYIVFVDSDDWIDLNSLREFSKVIEKKTVDVIETRFVEVYEDVQKCYDFELVKYVKKGFSKKKAISWILKKTHNTWPAPKRIYSTKFIKKNNLKFLNGKLHEDIDWTSNVLYYAESYDACTLPWYYHRMGRKGSITTSIGVSNIVDVIEIAIIHYNMYLDNPTKIRRKVVERIIGSVYGKLKYASKCSTCEQDIIVELISQNMKMLKLSSKFKYKLFYMGMKFLGIKRMLNIFK